MSFIRNYRIENWTWRRLHLRLAFMSRGDHYNVVISSSYRLAYICSPCYSANSITTPPSSVGQHYGYIVSMDHVETKTILRTYRAILYCNPIPQRPSLRFHKPHKLVCLEVIIIAHIRDFTPALTILMGFVRLLNYLQCYYNSLIIIVLKMWLALD